MNPCTLQVMRPSHSRRNSEAGDDDALQGQGQGQGQGSTPLTLPRARRRHPTGGAEHDEPLVRVVGAEETHAGVGDSSVRLDEATVRIHPDLSAAPGHASAASTTPEAEATDVEEMARRKMAFFFMDPVQKYRARHQVPWKLCLQFIKILLVTTVVYSFGNYRYNHLKYYADNQIALEHLFLKDWDAAREIHAYPPATGAYAIYKKSHFYDYFNYIGQQYFQLETMTVNPVFQDGPLHFCYETFGRGQVYENLTWDIDFNHLHHQTSCLVIPIEDLKDFDSHMYLREHDFKVPWDTLKWMQVNFTVQMVTYTHTGPLFGPECFVFHTDVFFDNGDYDGQIPISLTIDPYNRPCPHPTEISNATSVFSKLLNLTVVTMCAASFILCCRALLRAQLLRLEMEQFFKARFGWDLTSNEKLEFLNGWYIVICINDVLIIIGTVMKEMIETRNTYGDLWDFCSLFLGTGCLLVWIGMLRYLGFFRTYNVLIVTMKGALPNCFRFLVCGGLIYLGFVLCGWLILGPYHFKFKSLVTTSECLFSLINGDDMFATFSLVPGNSTMIWVFSRIYLYLFISLFIYVILSLFIAIIMDTYEIIKEYYKEGWPKQRMHEFYLQANYNPSSGIFRQNSSSNDSDNSCDRMPVHTRLVGFFRRIRSSAHANASANDDASPIIVPGSGDRQEDDLI